MAYIDGIDVSHYRGKVDWTQVAQAGKRFAIAKAAEGNAMGDTQFATNWDGIKAGGMLRGAYDFCIVGDDPQTQALTKP